MNKLLPVIAISLCAFIPFTAYCQAVPLDSVILEYQANPARATEKYVDKAYVTSTIKITGISYRTTPAGRVGAVSSGDYNHGDMEIQGIPIADILKLNTGDSIMVKGLISHRGKTAGDFTHHVLLVKGQVVKVLQADDALRTRLTTDHDCKDCVTDLKKYEEYIVEDILNSVRAEKEYLNKPYSFDMTITEFNKPNVVNYIKKGGIGGTVQEGNRKFKIVIYGIPAAEIMKMNVGDAINVKGTFVQTEGMGRRFTDAQMNHYDLITMNNCSLVK